MAEQKPENSKASENVPKISFPKPPTLQIDFNKIAPENLEMAEKFGIPIKAILQYFDDSARYNAQMSILVEGLYNNFEPAVKTTVGKMVQEAEAAAAKTRQTQPVQPPIAPQQGGMPGIMSMLANPQTLQALTQALGLGGGGSSAGLFGADFEKAAIEAMKNSFLGDIALGKTIREEVTKRLTGQAVKTVAEVVVPGAP